MAMLPPQVLLLSLEVFPIIGTCYFFLEAFGLVTAVLQHNTSVCRTSYTAAEWAERGKPL